MNNNRGGNNRRRGRGTNPRPQGTGGGPQVNRIDSRARGNAPQMLEKYRKLANDAHLNGDRVNAEYNLQFADHYFRVIADTRVRQEEQRLRRDDRWPEGGEVERDEGDDSGDFNVENEFPAFDQPPVYTRREREDRPERAERQERAPESAPERAPERTAERTGAERSQERTQSQSDTRRRDERPGTERSATERSGTERSGNDRPNGDRPNGDRQGARASGRFADQPQATPDEPKAAEQVATGDSGETPASAVTTYEPAENPFLRENRGGRGLRPRREDRRPRREDRPETAASGETQESDRAPRAVSAGIDPETLPPALTIAREEPRIVAEAIVPDAVVPNAVEADEAPVPAVRRRARRKPAADDAGEPVKSLI